MPDPIPTSRTTSELWPALPIHQWQDTCETLHMWSQIIGKIRLACTPKTNHWWNVTLYITARGLTTSSMFHHGRGFQIDFDFIDHRLQISTSDGEQAHVELASKTTAAFYREVMAALGALGLDVQIWPRPVEIEAPIPFDIDQKHSTYVAEHAQRFWRILLASDRVFGEFRSRFIGKTSPVHFFWGSFDLALTRFSLRQAPPHPGGIPNLADWVTREAYSHECTSCGFWPGGDGHDAVFYSYAYPEPDGYKDYRVRPEQAFYSDELSEFVLPYADLRECTDPDEELLDFLQSTYEAAAELGRWPREQLEYAAPTDAG